MAAAAAAAITNRTENIALKRREFTAQANIFSKINNILPVHSSFVRSFVR